MTDAQRGIHDGLHSQLEIHGTMDPCPSTPPEPGNGGNGGNGGMIGSPENEISSSSTSASAGVELTLTFPNLTAEDVAKIGVDGGSVEVFLEDDFQVDDIAAGSVYFRCWRDRRPEGGDGRRRPGPSHL